MNKTRKSEIESKLTVNSETLAQYLDCGRSTAVKIGELAGAKIKIGKRVLWNMSKVQKYIESISN